MSVLIIPVLISAFYCLMVCVCVAGRMSRHTRLIIRMPVVILGAVAAWAILRTLEGDWHISWQTVSHAIVVIAGAVILAMRPRIRT